MGRGWALLDRTLETSGQLAIRIAVVMVFALGALAASLGLDLLLGGFVAGVIARLALKGREVAVLESKLTAVGYGFLIPFFFVVSGINFDLDALTDDPIRLLELPLFLALFLSCAARRRCSCTAACSTSGTEPPWRSSPPPAAAVVAITTIAVSEGHMRSSTAAALVGAGILSTAIFPSSACACEPGPPRTTNHPRCRTKGPPWRAPESAPLLTAMTVGPLFILASGVPRITASRTLVDSRHVRHRRAAPVPRHVPSVAPLAPQYRGARGLPNARDRGLYRRGAMAHGAQAREVRRVHVSRAGAVREAARAPRSAGSVASMKSVSTSMKRWGSSTWGK